MRGIGRLASKLSFKNGQDEQPAVQNALEVEIQDTQESPSQNLETQRNLGRKCLDLLRAAYQATTTAVHG